MKILHSVFISAFMTASLLQSQEFYKESFDKYNEGDVWIGRSSDNKRVGVSRDWDEWPRPAGVPGAEISSMSKEGTKALKINPGMTVYSWNWDRTSKEATQENLYYRFYVCVIPEPDASGTLASVKIQQENNKTGAFVALNMNKGKLIVAASNGDGKDYVKWEQIANVQKEKWIRIDIVQHFKEKTYDVSVDGAPFKKDFKFRHAESWQGSIWPADMGKPQCRIDFEAGQKTTAYIDNIVFSSEPLSQD